MNKERRKQLAALAQLVDTLRDELDNAGPDDSLEEKIGSIRVAAEGLQSEEQDAFDNLPESLQVGERGQSIEAAIDKIDEALDNLREAENAVRELSQTLAYAFDALEEVAA